MVVEMFEILFNPVFVCDVESFVAHLDWVCCQQRRLATDFFVKELKHFSLNAVVVRMIFSVNTALEARVPQNVVVLRDFGFVGFPPMRFLYLVLPTNCIYNKITFYSRIPNDTL